jgi:glycosyltransferase involved in cell wall biosynthesis
LRPQLSAREKWCSVNEPGDAQQAMKILVMDINYPSDTNLYGDVFVHARVQGYIARGHEVQVLAFFTRGASYSFEGVEVTCVSSLEALREAIRDFAPDVIAIHFFQGWMLEKLVRQISVPIVVWIHGMEALGWYRRLFDFPGPRELARHIAANVVQLVRMRSLYAYVHQNRTAAALVFVSQWMRDTAASDALTDIRPYHLIPNPIDTSLFSYERKDPALRARVLLIRSFGSRKYANDIAIDTILAMRERKEFAEFHYTIVGSGKFFAKLTAPLRELSNVTLMETFVTREQMRELHTQNGVFLCPTRQDAQGVSMCEAMASGLVPVTSKSTAIPEFVAHEETGFLCESSAETAAALSRLWHEPELFQKMSEAGAKSITAKASAESVIPRELELMSIVHK